MKGYVVDLAVRAGEMLHGEEILSDIHHFLGEVFLEGAAQHLVHDFLGGGLGGDVRGIHHHAVAHDRVALADADDFVNPVRDKDDGDILRGLQMLDQAEELLGLRIGEGSGGLVQDQEITLVDDGPGDEHHLLLGQREILNQFMCIDLNIQPLEHLGRAPVEASPVHDIPAVHDGVIQHDVFRHGQRGDQRHIHFLINNLYSQFFGGQGGPQIHHLVIEVYLSGIIRIRAGQHLHQGGFSGAVGAHEGVDFSRADLEVDVGQRFDARKLDGDVPGSQSDLFHTVTLL